MSLRSLTSRRLLKLIVATIAVLVVALAVDARLVYDSLARISPSDIAILAALSFLLIGASVWKWGCFLRHLGICAGFWRLFRLYLIGYFVNVFTPSFVGGDVVRSFYIGSSVDKAHAVSATFLERYTGVVAMLAMALCAVFLSDVVTFEIQLLVVSLAAGCGLATWFIFAGTLGKLANRVRAPQRIIGIIDRVHEGLAWGVKDFRLVAKTLAISLMFHVLTVINTAAVAQAIGWSAVPWTGLLIVVPLILIVGAVPISPQGLGIQEGAFVFFLSSVGATVDQALAIALVLRAKSYVLALCGGFLWLGIRSPNILASNDRH
ncbi:MAG: hypothetical protein RL326_1246 [Pseudomonadota bacterium]